MAHQRQNLTHETAQYLGRAHQFLQAGQIAKAEELIAMALHQAPRSADAWHLLALCKKNGKDFDAADKAFHNALAAQPNHPHILNNYANMLTALARFKEAEQFYQKALQAQPDYVDALFNFGIMCTQIEAYDSAVKLLEQANHLSPKNTNIQNALGLALKKLGKLDAAISVFKTALTLAPQSPKITHNLSLALLSAERAEEALSLASNALNQGITSAEMRMNQASALDHLGHFEKAIEAYKTIISIDPDYILAYDALSKLLWEHGHNTSYTDHYKDSLEHTPKNTQVLRSYATALRKGGRLEQALALLLQLPEEERPSDELGLVYTSLGQYTEAEAVYQKVLKNQPNNTDLLTAFSYHLLCAHKPDAALRYAEKAVSLAPLSQLAWAYLGLSWRLVGDERYHWLNDYENFVRPIEINPPDNFKDRQEFNAALEATLLSYHVAKHHPADQTLRGGTQTNGSLFLKKEPLIHMVQDRIEAAIRTHTKQMAYDAKHPYLSRKSERFSFSGSWSVRLFSLGHHINHVHPQGWISSAYYVALPQTTKTSAENAGYIQFGAPPIEMNYALPPERIIKPEVGKLVLFPSYMWHGTLPFTGDDHRMSIAFDIKPQ